jgi:hypothetical protein
MQNLLVQLSQDTSGSLSATETQNELDILHCIPVARGNLVLSQFTMIGESQEVINSLLN